MAFLLTTALKDLRRRLADPLVLAVWAGIPLLIGGLIGLMGGSGDAPSLKARVLVADLDDTTLSGALTRSDWGGLLEIESVGQEEGRRRMDEGEAAALLVVPQGFQEGVLREQPTRLTLVTNPAMRIAPRIVEEGLEILLEGGFYAQRLLGPELRQLAEGVEGGGITLDETSVVATASSLYQRLERIGTVALPPVLDVELEKVDSAPRRQIGFGELFLPGFLFMAVVFVAQGMSDDVWTEKREGTLRRALSAPRALALFFGGKLLASALLVAAVATVGLGVGAFFFGLPLSALPLAILWCAYAGASLFTFFTLIQLMASTQRVGGLLTMMVVFPLIMVGGSFFPFEAMPGWMREVGRFTPNGLALLQLKAILFGGSAASSLLTAALGIGLPAALAFFLCLRRLGGRFALG